MTLRKIVSKLPNFISRYFGIRIKKCKQKTRLKVRPTTFYFSVILECLLFIAIGKIQGWEFALWFSEQITRFLWKMSKWAILSKKRAIRIFYWANLSKSLTVALFWLAILSNCSRSLIFGEQPERFAHSRSFVMSTWAICLHHSWKKRVWVNHSFFSKLTKNVQKIQFNSKFFERITRFCEQKSKWVIC